MWRSAQIAASLCVYIGMVIANTNAGPMKQLFFCPSPFKSEALFDTRCLLQLPGSPLRFQLRGSFRSRLRWTPGHRSLFQST
eukprot:1190861-Prorocentrum_minimum.AAC.2